MRAASILRLRPNLEVYDVEVSVEFYSSLLGVDVLDAGGEPLAYAVLGFDEPLMAVVRNEDPAVSEVTEFFVEVDDLEPVIERCAEFDLEVVQQPVVHPWGLRELAVRDPSGHFIGVGEQVEVIDASAEPEPESMPEDGDEERLDLA